MARIIQFEGRQIEMPDDVTDEEVARILSGQQESQAPKTGIEAIGRASNPITGFTEAPEVFSSVREASRGGAPAALEMVYGQPGSTQEAIAGSIGRLMGMPSRAKLESGAEALDPALANLSGLGAAGAHAVFRPLAENLALAGRGLKGAASIGVNELIGQPLDVREGDELSRYILEGTPTNLLPPSHPVDTSNTALNVATGLGTEAFNAPVETAGMLALGPKYVKGLGVAADMPRRAAEATGLKTPRHVKAVDILQEALKPSVTNEIGVEFEGIGENSLRQGVKHWKDAEGRTYIDKGLDATRKANRVQGNKFEEMYTHGDKIGAEFDGAVAANYLQTMAQHPYFQFADPAMGAKIMELAESYRLQPKISARQAGEILQFINKMREAARNRVGAAEARVETSPTDLQLKEISDAIRADLNQKISRTPNEFLEVSRDFGDTAKLIDLLERAKVKARNEGKGKSALLSPVGGEGLGGKMYNAVLRYALRGLERTPDRLVGKAFKLGAKADFPEPSAIPPQKPTSLPPPGGAQPPPPTTPPIPPSGGGGGTFPGGGNIPITPIAGTPQPGARASLSPIPQEPVPPMEPPRDVVQESLGSARSGRGSIPMKTYMQTQVGLMEKAGLSSEQIADFISGGAGEQMKNITLRHLSGELSEADAINLIKGEFGKVVDPNVPVPGPPEPPKPPQSGKPFVPINLTPSSGDVFLDPPKPPSGKQNFIGPLKGNLPDWIKNAVKSSKSRDPVDAWKDAKALADVLIGKHKMSPNQILNDPSVSFWAKQVLKDALKHPNREESFTFLRMLEGQLKFRMDKDLDLGATEALGGYGSMEKPTTENVPIEGEVGDILKPPTPGIPRPPTPGSSANEPGFVPSILREAGETISGKKVKFQFEDGKSFAAFMLSGKAKSPPVAMEQTLTSFKETYPSVPEKQIKAAMREYGKFVRETAELQGTTNSRPISFDRFVKTTYPSIFGSK